VSSGPAKIRVLLVDDHPVVREGVRSMIVGQPDMDVVGEAESGHETLASYEKLRPDVVLLDLRLPDMDGIRVIEELRRQDGIARVIVLTTYSGDVQARRALKAGAVGYLLKASARRELREAIRTVFAGGVCVQAEVALELAQHTGGVQLTPRELEVLHLVALGYSNKLVADHLNIGADTVKAHMTSILAKLKANDRTHAVTIALQRGFLDL